MALGPHHEEGISLSDLLVPLGLAIVLTTSVSIAKEHPINNMAFGPLQSPQSALVSPRVNALEPIKPSAIKLSKY